MVKNTAIEQMTDIVAEMSTFEQADVAITLFCVEHGLNAASYDVDISSDGIYFEVFEA